MTNILATAFKRALQLTGADIGAARIFVWYTERELKAYQRRREGDYCLGTAIALQDQLFEARELLRKARRNARRPIRKRFMTRPL